jgi:hypothetical protein
MAHSMSTQADSGFRGARALSASWDSPSYQAYQILHIGFTVAPIVAGLDKFLHLLVNWDMYLAPAIANLSPIGGHNLMLLIGVIEIAAGIIVAIKPKIGGYIVAAWLMGIILNCC